MGLLAANKNELAARGAGAVVLGAGAVSWLSARTGGGAGRVLAPLPVLLAGKAHRCWCQLIARAVEVRKRAVQAAYTLVPAGRMSTGRGILPSYLGLCWCHFLYDVVRRRKEAVGSYNRESAPWDRRIWLH